MNKKVEMPARSNLQILVDQANAPGFQSFQSPRNIVDMKRDVVHAFAALGEKPADRRVLSCRLQQFNPALAYRDHRRPHLLVLNRFFMHHVHPQRLVESARRRDALHRNPQMIDRRQIIPYRS